MLHATCDFCGKDIGSPNLVNKIKLSPWARNTPIFEREWDCCDDCIDVIETKLLTIINNYLWRGDNPDKYKNWSLFAETKKGKGDA